MLAIADELSRPVLLEVRTDNAAAITLYQAHGFVRLGLRKRYYQPSDADAYTMGRPRRRAAMEEPDDRGPIVLGDALVLGIETSCDETGVGIVRRAPTARSNCSPTRSPPASMSTPASAAWCPRWPAARTWRPWCPTVHRALEIAGVKPSDVDAIAVTAGPGLAGALLVGLAAAKAYSVAWDVPLYGVNHLAAHVAVDTIEHGPLPGRRARAARLRRALQPARGRLRWPRPIRTLGATIDDAAGEAFDKVARLLGLPFPGGPYIDRAAREGDADRHRLPARPDRPAGRHRTTSPSPA